MTIKTRIENKTTNKALTMVKIENVPLRRTFLILVFNPEKNFVPFGYYTTAAVRTDPPKTVVLQL